MIHTLNGSDKVMRRILLVMALGTPWDSLEPEFLAHTGGRVLHPIDLNAFLSRWLAARPFEEHPLPVPPGKQPCRSISRHFSGSSLQS
jgi:hypothetical protein